MQGPPARPVGNNAQVNRADQLGTAGFGSLHIFQCRVRRGHVRPKQDDAAQKRR